jgi:hypothetical protein
VEFHTFQDRGRPNVSGMVVWRASFTRNKENLTCRGVRHHATQLGMILSLVASKSIKSDSRNQTFKFEFGAKPGAELSDFARRTGRTLTDEEGCFPRCRP